MEVNRDGTLGILTSKADEKSGKNKVVGVWNLETGERLALLDRPLKPLRSAFFSENGATIMSMHGELKEAELSFWDAATFSHRAAITFQDLSFHQLSRDGEHIYIGSAKANKWLGITVIGFETSKGIGLWNTRTGKLEKTYADGDIKFWNPFNSSPVVSSDEKYLAARSDGNKIIVWETAGDGSPKYAIPAGDPKKKLRLLGMSSDSRYLLTARDEEAEIYDLGTGKLYRKFSLKHDSTYDLSPDSKYAFRRSQGSVGVYDLENEKHLYALPLTVRTEQRENEANYEYEVESIRVSPDSKFIMVYGDRDVRIYDIATGEALQTLVDPQRAKYKDNGKIKSNGLDNNRVGWLASGDSIYVFAEDGRSFYIWNKK
jgi:WD40 repeat protein